MPRLVDLRLMGEPNDVAEVADRLQDDVALQVAQRSEPYPNRRGGGVRVYLTAVIADPDDTTPAQQSAAGQTPDAIPNSCRLPDSP